MAWKFFSRLWYRRKLLMGSASYSLYLLPWLKTVPHFLADHA